MPLVNSYLTMATVRSLNIRPVALTVPLAAMCCAFVAPRELITLASDLFLHAPLEMVPTLSAVHLLFLSRSDS